MLGALVLPWACSDHGQESATSSSPVAEPADFVFTNGDVYTVDASNSRAQALAARGNEIVYVGDNAGAAAFVGSGTESIDIAGKLTLPGLPTSPMPLRRRSFPST